MNDQERLFDKYLFLLSKSIIGYFYLPNPINDIDFDDFASKTPGSITDT